MDNLLEIRGLTVSFGTTKAVDNVSLCVPQGEIVGVAGESGSGKSTIALSIMRLLEPSAKVSGKILWRGMDILEMEQRELEKFRGSDISMIFQDPFSSLDPILTVGEQIAEIFRHHLGLSKTDSWERAVKMLEKVHIRDARERARDFPHQFSGGMKQRVAIAMACALSPKLIIADEPTTALDVTTQKSILELLQEFKCSMIFISHNIALISGLCPRMYVMKNGTVVESGATKDIINSPKELYTAKLISSFRELSYEHN
jgi:ABC-type dipeptide/oligopeptide/nickel transport system ATPase component